MIDGRDQSAFLSGAQDKSNREGFIFWNATDPALPLSNPHIVNLLTDPKEREPFHPVYYHSWTMAHFGRLLRDFHSSTSREPLIPAGAALNHVPRRSAA